MTCRVWGWKLVGALEALRRFSLAVALKAQIQLLVNKPGSYALGRNSHRTVDHFQRVKQKMKMVSYNFLV